MGRGSRSRVELYRGGVRAVTRSRVGIMTFRIDVDRRIALDSQGRQAEIESILNNNRVLVMRHIASAFDRDRLGHREGTVDDEFRVTADVQRSAEGAGGVHDLLDR